MSTKAGTTTTGTGTGAGAGTAQQSTGTTQLYENMGARIQRGKTPQVRLSMFLDEIEKANRANGEGLARDAMWAGFTIAKPMIQAWIFGGSTTGDTHGTGG